MTREEEDLRREILTVINCVVCRTPEVVSAIRKTKQESLGARNVTEEKCRRMIMRLIDRGEIELTQNMKLAPAGYSSLRS